MKLILLMNTDFYMLRDIQLKSVQIRTIQVTKLIVSF
jgi:hypothetical protein